MINPKHPTVQEKCFVLYATKEVESDPEDGLVLATADSEEEATNLSKNLFKSWGGVWYEYEIDKNEILRNGKSRPGLHPYPTP